jgi:REP element-mobilizing transposase RayT
MSEHVHLLFWPTISDYNVSEILNTIKQSVSKRALLFVHREASAFLARMEDRQPNGTIHHRFWQRGGGCTSTDRLHSQQSGAARIVSGT